MYVAPIPCQIVAAGQWEQSVMPEKEQWELRPDHRLACHRLAIEVFKGYDQQLLNPKSSPAVRSKAFKRLQAALPNLAAFLNNHLLEFEDREYVNDLLQRLVVKSR